MDRPRNKIELDPEVERIINETESKVSPKRRELQSNIIEIEETGVNVG